ncbi:hypothetical protein [Sinomonas sp. P47F7]|uniref:hypothetical protein n=1 Tax=Sinomonas sp. P47F7 TaxID=3410987 RepID=UPI003BF4F4C1
MQNWISGGSMPSRARRNRVLLPGRFCAAVEKAEEPRRSRPPPCELRGFQLGPEPVERDAEPQRAVADHGRLFRRKDPRAVEHGALGRRRQHAPPVARPRSDGIPRPERHAVGRGIRAMARPELAPRTICTAKPAFHTAKPWSRAADVWL